MEDSWLSSGSDSSIERATLRLGEDPGSSPGFVCLIYWLSSWLVEQAEIGAANRADLEEYPDRYLIIIDQSNGICT